jgi:hypothetical protein
MSIKKRSYPMRKIAISLLLTTCCLIFVGCASKAATQTTEPATPTQPVAQQDYKGEVGANTNK